MPEGQQNQKKQTSASAKARKKSFCGMGVWWKGAFYKKPPSSLLNKASYANFAPPTASEPPGGKAQKSVAYGAAKPQPTPDFWSR